jgi:hypothetical protein
MAKKHKRKASSKNKPASREPDKIVSSRVEPDGVEMFRLRWKNCEAAEDIWRTRKQLGEEAETLLAAFRETAIRRVDFKETVLLKRTNAAGNSVEEEVELKG